MVHFEWKSFLGLVIFVQNKELQLIVATILFVGIRTCRSKYVHKTISRVWHFQTKAEHTERMQKGGYFWAEYLNTWNLLVMSVQSLLMHIRNIYAGLKCTTFPVRPKIFLRNNSQIMPDLLRHKWHLYKGECSNYKEINNRMQKKNVDWFDHKACWLWQTIPWQQSLLHT